MAATYLKAQDIANDLQISRAHAYRIMREMLPIRVGRSLRISATSYQAWKEGKHMEWQTQNPVGSTVYSAPIVKDRSSVAIASSLPVSWSSSKFKPIQPRTKPKTTP